MGLYLDIASFMLSSSLVANVSLTSSTGRSGRGRSWAATWTTSATNLFTCRILTEVGKGREGKNRLVGWLVGYDKYVPRGSIACLVEVRTDRWVTKTVIA